MIWGGLTLGAGVYNEPSSLGLTGTLTLDAGGDPNAVWIFQAGSTLITSSSSNILLIGGAQASNIFWQVGTSATLGTGSHFEGSILASESITLNTGATLTGRALALVGAVTMDNNYIQVPEASSMLLLGAGLGSLLARRTRGALLARLSRIGGLKPPSTASSQGTFSKRVTPWSPTILRLTPKAQPSCHAHYLRAGQDADL